MAAGTGMRPTGGLVLVLLTLFCPNIAPRRHSLYSPRTNRRTRLSVCNRRGTHRLFDRFSLKSGSVSESLDATHYLSRIRAAAGSSSDFPPSSVRPIVALIGRPNVGKSSLFNKMIGERLAVVDNRAGTTRDRLFSPVTWKNATFDLVDSGGIDWGEQAYERDIRLPRDAHGKPGSREFIREIREQAMLAMEMADLVLVVVDAGKGVLEADKQVVSMLRELEKEKDRMKASKDEEEPHTTRVQIVVNKADNEKMMMEASQFWELGMGEPLAVSAKHDVGIDLLLNQIAQQIPPVSEELFLEREDLDVNVALIGKPNVGKSSLINAILGEERAIVSNVAGTTRDSLDTPLIWEAGDTDEEVVMVNMIDTAGLIKEKKITEEVDRWSIMRTYRALSRAEVAILVVDGSQSFSPQDAAIANMVLDRGRSLIVAINKWDAVASDGFEGQRAYTREEYLTWLADRFPPLEKYIPVVFTSASERRNVQRLVPLAIKVHESRLKVIPTSILSRVVDEYTRDNRPPRNKEGKQLNFLFAVQKSNNPPTFEIRFNDVSLIRHEFKEGLEDMLRENFGYRGSPIRLSILGRKDK